MAAPPPNMAALWREKGNTLIWHLHPLRWHPRCLIRQLSGAIAVTGNSLVFHSFEHFANMFIHAGPMLAAWALRW
eukprot:5959250-Prymnesium_polylepis.2